MAGLTQTTFDYALKEMYTKDSVENVAKKNRPLLSMLKRKDDFEGDVLPIPLVYELANGRSATFATAQTNAAASRGVKFSLTQKADYGVITIDALTVRASRSKLGAFMEARKTEIDSMLMALGRSASIALYGTGGGSIGQVGASGISGSTITLSRASDAKNFGVGMKIVSDTVDGTGTVNSGTLTVASVQEAAGTVTFTTGIASTISGIASTHHLFVEGDYGAKIQGLAGWLPLTVASSGDSWMGVDRYPHRARLAGAVVDATSNSMEENILTLAEQITEQGGSPDCCFISHTNFSNLVKGLGTKVNYNDNTGKKANVGFRGVDIHTSAGTVTVYADPDCPANRGYVLTMDSWTLHTLDGLPHIDNLDGKDSQRQASSDGIEIRMRYWANLGCNAPAWNGVFTI